MAFQTRLSAAACQAAVNAVVDLLDSGTVAAGGQVKIFSGAQPASPGTGGTAGTLATITLSATAFGAAALSATNYQAASAAGLPKSDTNAAATGTAAWFRAYDRDGTAIIDGDIGTTTSTADMAIDNASISAGQTVKLNSWKVRQQFKG